MIHLGTSGYSYADWVGPVYPPGTRSADMLELYAQRFRTVEINSTYYRLPGARTFAGMAKRVGPDFRFSVKLPGEVTHRGDLSGVDRFLEATRPLAEAGQLACVLAQFPYRFKNDEASRGYLAQLAAKLTGPRLVVEFRHAGWQIEPMAAFLRRLGCALAAVDAPALPNLPRPEARATAPVGYIRFHGRNAEKWFEHERAEERYDYRYSEPELAGWIERVRALERSTEDLFIYFNNHFRGQAVDNAGQLAVLLGEPLPPGPARLFT